MENKIHADSGGKKKWNLSIAIVYFIGVILMMVLQYFGAVYFDGTDGGEAVLSFLILLVAPFGLMCAFIYQMILSLAEVKCIAFDSNSVVIERLLLSESNTTISAIRFTQCKVFDFSNTSSPNKINGIFIYKPILAVISSRMDSFEEIKEFIKQETATSG